MSLNRIVLLSCASALFVVGCGDDGTVAPGVDGGGTDGSTGSDGSTPGCVGMADGTSCGDSMVCLAETCLASRCGDGFANTATGEECDDGNETSGDGCEPSSCTFSCSTAADCADGNPCNGVEACNEVVHRCQAGVPPVVETMCIRDDGMPGVCAAGGLCRPAGCGNGALEAGEDCDDMNEIAGDGCEIDCSFSCVSNEECADDNACNGAEVCNLESHACEDAAAPLDCDDEDACTADSCEADGGCVNTFVDADGDGFSAVDTCTTPGLMGGDCDDMEDAVHPGVAEVCDDVDNDCNGSTDEGLTVLQCIRDRDGDGFGTGPIVSGCSCDPGFTVSDGRADCDDTDRRAFPGQTMFFTTERMSGGYDYDCDRTLTPSRTAVGGLIACRMDISGCTGHGWQGASVPRCGVTTGYTDCLRGCSATRMDTTQACN